MVAANKTLSCEIGVCSLHNYSAMVVKIVLVLSVGCCLLISCAPARTPVMKPPVQPSPRTADKNIMDNLKDFRLEILAENYGLCPGRDGKNMIFLGRDARLQLVLTFSQIPPTDVRPDDLVARIAHLTFPFAQRTSERVYMTDIVELNSLEHGLNTGPTGLSMFYKDRDEEVFLGTQGRLAIDTIPPPEPINLRVTESGPDYFSLTWEYAPGDIKEYRVQKWDSGQWLTIHSGFRSPPVRIKSKPEGRFRIVAVDCALNRSFSEEVVIAQAKCLSITRTGCGKRRYLAYRAAQVLINEGFVRGYVSPWLKANTVLGSEEVNILITERLEGWVPPGIKYTPENEAKYFPDNGLWCGEITGSLDRNFFENWIRKRSKTL